MIRNNTPYIYGEYDDEDVPDETELRSEPDSDVVARETVIDSGVAMSYRNYQAKQDRQDLLER